MSTILTGVLEHSARDKVVKKESGQSVYLCLLSHWKHLEGCWKGATADADYQLSVINILRKLLSLEPSVSLCQDLLD